MFTWETMTATPEAHSVANAVKNTDFQSYKVIMLMTRGLNIEPILY